MGFQNFYNSDSKDDVNGSIDIEKVSPERANILTIKILMTMMAKNQHMFLEILKFIAKQRGEPTVVDVPAPLTNKNKENAASQSAKQKKHFWEKPNYPKVYLNSDDVKKRKNELVISKGKYR